MKLAVLAIIAAAGILLQGATENPEATRILATRNGRVEGAAGRNASILVFKGIPFAAPPVGELRWRAPQPVVSWSGVRSAREFSASCIQNIVRERKPWTYEFMTHTPISEDCLYLNVWTKTGFSDAKRPVLVYFYGGGFNEGSGSVPVYDGEALAAKGMVVVNFNYRVGIFGFFAHPELTQEASYHASGNYGLLDQIAALDWVRDNIAAFGGDPTRVTIAGQSAGASSVHALTASPLAKGLFQGAVAMSGSRPQGLGLMRARTLADQEKDGMKFAESKGLHTMAELRMATAEQLSTPRISAGPVVDGYVLPASVDEIFAQGKQIDVPTMTGWTKDDMGVVSNPKTTVETFEQSVKQRYGEMADAFLKAYPASTDAEAREVETESSRDQLRVAMWLWASNRAKTARTNTYTYYWDHVLPGPDSARYGAFHSSEVPYFFDVLTMAERPYMNADQRIAGTMSDYILQFVSRGDPNPAGLEAWPAFSRNASVTMEIGDRTGTIPIAGTPERIQFWLRQLGATSN